VAVFLPIVFVQGIAGQIFKDQAITVSASQVISLIVALTLIPVFLSLGLRRRATQDGAHFDELGIGRPPAIPAAPAVDSPRRRRRTLHPIARAIGRVLDAGLVKPIRWVGRGLFVLVPGLVLRLVRLAGSWLGRVLDFVLRPVQSVFDRTWDRLSDWYPTILRAALRHRRRTGIATVALALVAVGLYRTLGLELVPQFSQGEFTFDIELPAGTPLSVTENTVRRIGLDLANDERIRVLFTTVGESSELGSARTERSENVAQLNIVTTHPGNRKQEQSLIESIRERLASDPTLRYQFRRPTYFSFQTPIEIHVYGHDLDAVQQYADGLVVSLGGVEGLRDIESSLEGGNPEVQVSFRRDRLASLDLDIQDVSRTLRNKIHGNVATKYKERDRQLDVLVRTAQAATMDVGQVENIIVSQVDGVPIPLSSVADVGVDRGPVAITHVGQQRAAIIRANLAGRDLGSATTDVRAVLASHPPSANLAASLAGQNDEISVSFRSLILAAALAVFMVYLVMACEFESFLHPLVIMLSVPLGLVGAVLALAVTRTPISVVVLIGVILLCGIVVNNAIVLIDFVNQRRREGMDKITALVDAGQTRLRPIFMTTLTTVLGLAPMAFGLGEGAEIRAPMAIAVIGGLSFATLLTLVLIPVVYATVDRRP
jgi:multidrug efflux pump subunit AcrB